MSGELGFVKWQEGPVERPSSSIPQGLGLGFRDEGLASKLLEGGCTGDCRGIHREVLL